MMKAPNSLRTMPSPYEDYAALRRACPVLHDSANDVWIVSRHADVRAVLRQHRQFSSSVLAHDSFEIRSPHDGAVLGSEETLLASGSPRHDTLRAHVARLFAPARLAACEAAARDELDRVVARLMGRERFEVVRDVCAPVTAAVMAALLGLDASWHPQVARWLRVSGECNARSRPDTLRAAFEAMLDEIWHAATHCADAGLGTFMAACRDGGIDARHVIDLAVTLLKGGADTTTFLVGNVLALLAEWPDLMARVREDPASVPALIEESLRLDSPVQLTVRLSTAETELAGVRIPAGARVLLLLGSANRDEAVFEDAGDVRPGREARSHLAFGAGPHRCPGVALARMQGALIVQALVGRLPDYRVTPEGAEETELRALRGFKRIDVEFVAPHR